LRVGGGIEEKKTQKGSENAKLQTIDGKNKRRTPIKATINGDKDTNPIHKKKEKLS